MKLLRRAFKKVLKGLTIMLPHTGVVFLLLSYIGTGAAIFRWIEIPAEMEQIDKKLLELRQIYEDIAFKSRSECKNSYVDYSAWMTEALRNLSIAHNLRYAQIDHDDIIATPYLTGAHHNASTGLEAIEYGKLTRWTYAAAVLYALGTVSTTGYSYVQVTTTVGKIFGIAFGMLGFPLVFVSAADIGKLLSSLVKYIVISWKERQRFRRHRAGSKSSSAASSIGLVSPKISDTVDADDDDAIIELPAWAIVGTIFGLCGIGSFIYMALENWHFIDALYFAFNAVASITLGDLPISSFLFALISVLYVTFGFAVVTMSIDLAKNQLRSLFNHIHYFGRRIRTLRGLFDSETRDMMLLIAGIRKTNPQKEKITEEDIAAFLKQKLDERAERRKVKPHLYAFIPQEIGVIQFVDVEDKSGLPQADLSPFEILLEGTTTGDSTRATLDAAATKELGADEKEDSAEALLEVEFDANWNDPSIESFESNQSLAEYNERLTVKQQ